MSARTIFALGASALTLATAPVALAAPGATTATTTSQASMHRWGQRQNGRWYAGWSAPGGWNGYRRPVTGYVLPRYWVNPAYAIADYRAYGLTAPAAGYGWSRYYDDAVMTDQYGRVYQVRSGIDWARYEGGYDDGARPAGTDYAYGYADDSVTYNNEYQGQWVGTWHGQDGRSYSGTYDGRYQGASRGNYGVDYDAPANSAPAHWSQSPAPAATLPPGGYISNGYYYPPPTVTTVVVEADGTTRTTTSQGMAPPR